jgi:hypothetical protein
MTQTEALRLALEALEKISMGGDPRWADQAITAIKAALANEALERKAENAKELGLDYEPLETPKEKYIYGTPLLDAMTKEKK